MPRAARIVVAIAAVPAAIMLGFASPAAAHDYLVGSTPSEGETLTALPDEWTVTATSPLLTLEGNDAAFAIVVTDAEGLYYGDGCVEVSGPTMAAPAALGKAGEYDMTFQYVSSDGHTLSEIVAFTYAPESEQPVTEGSTAAPACGGETTAGADGEAAAGDGTTTDETAAVLAAVAWIGGGLLAAAAVAAIIVLANRRRPAVD